MTDLVAQLVGALERVDADWSSFWPLGPDVPSSSDRVCAIAPETAEIWRAIRAALSAAKDGGWLPIETAPKDGTVFLAYWRGFYRDAHAVQRSDGVVWSFGAWGFHSKSSPDNIPTHWQPLPNPPKGEV